MKKKVSLSICGKQYYPGQDPEVIELVTDGFISHEGDCWDIFYEESDLTGLSGVTTTFRLEPGKVTLQRTGRLRSQMVFQEGVPHDSLYQMEFGALMVRVCAKTIEANINEQGGTVDLLYDISIENTEAGVVEYHLDIHSKE